MDNHFSPRERSVDLGAGVEAEAALDAMAHSISPTKETEGPIDPDTKRNDGPSPPSRTPTLSWQRRPASRGGTRPLSMVAAQNATQRSLAGSQEPQPSSPNENISKEQITQALGSKDPSWFRQTSDRGQGSAAYRRSQVEDEDRLDMTSVRTQLPGMSAEPSKEQSISQPDMPAPALKKPEPPPTLNPPRFDGADEYNLREDISSAAPAGRLSPLRSTSPTKGMGGFVQSAMMKRSDSVKRWSVTSPPGLTRGGSIATNRGALDRSHVQSTTSRPQSMVLGGFTTPSSSRPTSQHGAKEIEVDKTPKSSTPETPKGPAFDQAQDQADEDAALPVSPSKTMDPRRWSPTKSSWLESALNKPESPKVPPKSTSSQPAWMTELSKTKVGRASNNSTGSTRPDGASHRHQVSISGLMRSTPMGSEVKTNTTGLGGIYSPPEGMSRTAYGHASSSSISRKMSTPNIEPRESGERLDDHKEVKAHEMPMEQRSAASYPPKPKPKPATPPKKDFRGILKPRSVESLGTKEEGPEFKNVVGKLRRVKTQNFVAPDELKDNILRGKAGLNITDGPQKPVRQDEFKDAILKKKDDFKKAQEGGKGITRNNTVTSDAPLPEGLAKRAELGRSITMNKRNTVSEDNTPLQQQKRMISPKPVPGPKRISSQSGSIPKSPISTPTSAKSPKLESIQRVSTESIPRLGDPVRQRPLPSLHKETSHPPKLQQGFTGSKLADRFSPALAGMLARGPSPIRPTGVQGAERTGSQPTGGTGDSAEQSGSGPQLTHMTKNRARGPKRKAPTAVAAAVPAASTTEKQRKTEISSPQPQEQVSSAARDGSSTFAPATSRDNLSRNGLDFATSEKQKPEPRNTSATFSIQQQVAAKAALTTKLEHIVTGSETTGNTRGSEQVKPLFLRRQPTGPAKPVTDPISAPQSPQKTTEDGPPPSSPKKLDMKRMSQFLDRAAVEDGKPESVEEPARLRHQRTGSRSPIKFLERFPEPRPLPSATASGDSNTINSFASNFGVSAKPVQRETTPISDPVRIDLEASKAQPKISGRPLLGPPIEVAKPASAVSSPARSPNKLGSDVSNLLNDFFGPTLSRKDYKVDTASILMNHPKSGNKIKSVSFQMCQLFGDGKQVPVPMHHERVLFEQEMYICAHNFINEAGWKKLEVYFWVGDEVPEATVGDAQLFVQREARSLGGTLIKLRQGKETSEFMQALGGVVIVRRGSSNKYDSLAPNMLCGRRYLGQVAFDEIDFAAASLCAGFVFLISHAGKCYLWNGKGSDVDELSCAKLVGMELAVTGELIEYEEGNEPSSFWDIFGGGPKPYSADHWRLKPNYGKYCSRLFCSDADSKQQVRLTTNSITLFLRNS